MNLGQVYTKQAVADFMVRLFTISGNARVLDPCFGRGVFVKSLLANTEFVVDGVEIDEASYTAFDNPDEKRCRLVNGDFFDVEETFDGIIMNPPYVRQEELDNLAPLGVTKQKLQSACWMMNISSKANLYMYFILRSILLLREGGELIAIFPNSWTNTSVGRQFYEQMKLHGSITDFINVEGEAFEGSPMVDVCILKYVKGKRLSHGVRIKTRYSKMMINSDDSLTLEQDEYWRIAKELCDDLDNNLHYVSIRLKEIQQEYHLTMEELDDLCWENSTAMFDEIYTGPNDDIYEKFSHRMKDGEETAYTSPHEYERRYNRSAF